MVVVDLSLLMDLGLLIIVATGIGFFIRALRQPSLVGYIIAGLLIGPAALGGLGIYIFDFPLGIGPEQMPNIFILSELGVAFLLFSIGVETDFSKMMGLKKILFFGGALHVFLLFGASFLLSSVLGIDFIQSIYIGMVLAFSSTMMVVKQLSDKHQISSLSGRLMIGFLLFEDAVIVLILPLLEGLQTTLSMSTMATLMASAVLLIGVAVALNKYILPDLIAFASKSTELFYLTALSVCFGFIGLAYVLNFSIAVGAFIGGLALSSLVYHLEILANIRGLRDFFATIFFVTLGMQLSFSFTAFPLELLIITLVVIYFLKPAIFGAITFLGGYGTRIAFAVGVALAQVSEFSFIILNQGFAGGTGPVSASTFSVLTLVIALSMASTPYFMNYTPHLFDQAGKISRRIGLSKFFLAQKRLDELRNLPVKKKKKGEKSIVIVGAGMLGGNILNAIKDAHPVIVVDHDPDTVTSLINQGVASVCGSAENNEVWTQINLKETELLIITVPRLHDFKDALMLYDSGADYVVIPLVLAGNTFVKHFAEFLESKDKTRIMQLRSDFIDYLKEKVAEEEKRSKRRFRRKVVEE
jgi:Kef-type K+ transport system membrane component KefB